MVNISDAVGVMIFDTKGNGHVNDLIELIAKFGKECVYHTHFLAEPPKDIVSYESIKPTPSKDIRGFEGEGMWSYAKTIEIFVSWWNEKHWGNPEWDGLAPLAKSLSNFCWDIDIRYSDEEFGCRYLASGHIVLHHDPVEDRLTSSIWDVESYDYTLANMAQILRENFCDLNTFLESLELLDKSVEKSSDQKIEILIGDPVVLAKALHFSSVKAMTDQFMTEDAKWRKIAEVIQMKGCD